MIANKLAKRLDPADWAITLVDRDDVHDYKPGYLFVPFGSYQRSDVRRTTHAQLTDRADLVFGEIDRVDPDGQRVLLADGRSLAYDYLVIATGAAPRPDQTPGMLGPEWHRSVAEFYSLDGAEALAEQLKVFSGGRLVVHLTELPITCPVAPLEFTFLVDDYLRTKGVRGATELVFVTPLDGAFTKPVASRHLGGMLAQRGIVVEPDFMIERVDQERKAIVSYDEREVSYDLLVTIPLNMGAEYVARSGLGDELNFVPVDRHTMQHATHPQIFALGDAASLPTSKAGSVAHFSVEVFVENFVELANGRPMTHAFDGHANCFVESGGGKALLLDFNYDTEPLPGRFPVPRIGPLHLLEESRANHLGKRAFRWVYWNVLLPGRPMPLPADMSMAGKELESASAVPGTTELKGF
jgi:sulfide:quinone oxidoreductase